MNMTEEVTIGQALRLSSPHPFSLVVSINDENVLNVMAVSWWTHASSSPPLLLVCLSKKSYTNSNIRNSKEFTLCLPDESIREEAFRAGTTSGKKVDKFKILDFKTVPASQIKPEIIKQSHLAYECRTVKIFEAGDHDIFLAEILKIHHQEGKKHLYASDGYAKLITI
jgi:flavin reductase (DIM6/NTAB) family NADH-FMN oxidoreductase RutF